MAVRVESDYKNAMSIFEHACRLKIIPEPLCRNGHESDPDARRIIARMAAEVIPEFRGLPNLVPGLAASVAVARDYARAVVRELGEPRRVGANSWARDPFIPVVFATPDEGLEAFRRAPAVRGVFEDGARDCFFLMTMRRHEFEILGSELDGEIVKRGVLQTVVGFEDHAIPIAAPSVAEARAAMADELVLFLSGLVPERVRRTDTFRVELHDSEGLLRARIATLEQASREFKPLSVPADLRGKLRQGREEFQALEDKLANLPRHPDTGRYLELVRDVLRHPHEHVAVERVTLYVQDFGIKVAKDKGREIQFIELRTGGKQRMAVLFARMSRDMATLIWPGLGGVSIQS